MRMPSIHRRRGFTLTEMLMTAFLMGLMGVLLGNAWAAFGRPAVANVARCRVAQEANLAAEALARDIGLLAVPLAQQPDSRYQNVQADSSIGTTLTLSIDDGTPGSPRTISYAADPDDSTRLVRTDLSAPAGSGRVVATLLAGFETQRDILADVSGVRIDLTFSHRTFDRDPDGTLRTDYTRRFTLFVPDPQP
jgi:prepilin-type N-terminal cleavage/methylation domain-containing protein